MTVTVKMPILNGYRLLIEVLLQLLLLCNVVHSSVTWYTSTKPVVFGQDVILTCYTRHPLLNTKDCPVHQWSGGPKRNGLVYNGYSSNDEKYEEEANLTTSQFSLKIKNFSESDVNVNYTCSCGFSTFTQKLELNNTHFYYFPTAFYITIDTKDHSVKVKIECNKVYPLPTCSVNIGNRLVFKDELPAPKKNGLFYSLKFKKEFALSADDCNKIPVVKCEFCKKCVERKLIEYSGKQTQECAVIQNQSRPSENVAMIDVESTNEASNNKTTVTVVIIVIITAVLIVATCFIVIIYCALQKRKKSMAIKKSIEIGGKEASDSLMQRIINNNGVYTQTTSDLVPSFKSEIY